MMKFWFDTEFIENGRTIDLLSIGIVSEDGREFYGENAEADLSLAGDWVAEYVIPHLNGIGVARPTLREHVREFVGPDKPEIWAYYADYDWVALCQLFGSMMDLPQSWPMYCRDIKQLCDDLGNPALPGHEGQAHNALDDARWNKKAWDFLQTQKT